MNISGYLIDLDKTIETIRGNNYKIIALQIPEGLKSSTLKIVDKIEKETKCEIIIIADPCFGACDIANHELKNIGVEFVIQIGHTPISNLDYNVIPTIFINALSSKNITQVIEKSLVYLEGIRIGIVTTAQHVHTIKIVENILKKQNFISIISDGDKRIYKKGQILGCNFSAGLKIADKVDSFLFIGSGNFHPVGLLLSAKKPVIAADPYTIKIKKQELIDLKDKILRQRYGAIVNSKNAKIFGILIGIKRGQQRIKLAHKIKEMLESLNKKSFYIALDNFSSMQLQSFRDIDCFVSTSCPRIAIDDYLQYKKPIITPIELEISLNKRKWDDYQFDQIINDK
jgi:2-(3-amino-3-carboxypropyl)histidine synthase